MAKTKECKVLFNTLLQKMRKKTAEEAVVYHPLYCIDEVIKFTMKQSKKNRFFELKNGKFCFLESVQFIQGKLDKNILILGFFKSAKNEFRPDLINKKTGHERPNPKEISEGDIEKTHFVIRIDRSVKEVYLFLQSNFDGIHIKNVINYFSEFNNKYLDSIKKKRTYSVKHAIIARNNFLTELDTLSRTRIAEISFDKKLLGSNALNFSNRTVGVKHDVKLIATAALKESIKEVAVDCFNAFNSENSDISKVRVYGTDEHDNEVVIDTDFMSRIEYVTVGVNENTGELNTTELLDELKRIANNF